MSARPTPYKVPFDQYQGKELLPFDGRPGSNDAMEIPSRIGGVRRYRDGREEKTCKTSK